MSTSKNHVTYVAFVLELDSVIYPSLLVREIKKELKDDFKKQSQITKLLLLGTGESGKSTILKQMKIIANADKNITGLSDEEKKSQISIIRNNVLDSIEVWEIVHYIVHDAKDESWRPFLTPPTPSPTPTMTRRPSRQRSAAGRTSRLREYIVYCNSEKYPYMVFLYIPWGSLH